MENSNIRERFNIQNKMDGNVVCQFPKNMLMELTNLCNDSCAFCANSKSTRKRGIIKPELAEKILREAYGLGTREVGFYQTGEPLLDKNLEKYIGYAKHLGYEYVYITTNGALLTEQRANAIIEAGIDSIKFSINASNPKDYMLMHGKDEFEQVIGNLIYIDDLRKRQKRKISLYISYVVTRYTEAEREEFQSKYRRYADDIVFMNCKNVGGLMKNEITKYLSVGSSVGHYYENDMCPMIFNRLHITYEGYLTMCCMDFQNYLVVSDLNKESLKDAWNNSYACDLRKRHLDHTLEGTMCFNCINNCTEFAQPLRAEYASRVNLDEWDKSEEIMKRIQNQ